MAETIFEEFKKDARKAGSGSLASGYRPNIPTKRKDDTPKEVPVEDVNSKDDIIEDISESDGDVEESRRAVSEEKEIEVDEFEEDSDVESSGNISEIIESKEKSKRDFLKTRQSSSGNIVKEEEEEEEEPVVQEKIPVTRKTLKDYENELKSRREIKEFSSLIVETEDGDYYWNTKSKTVRVEIGQALISGVRDYLSSLYGDNIKSFSNPQLITYLLIKQLPKDIREDLANQIALEQNGYDKVYAQVVEDLSRDTDPASMKNMARDLSMVKEELSLISSSQTNQYKEMTEMFPALLVALSFLSADRMDLRKRLNEGSFKNFIVKEDDMGDWMEDLINLGHSYRSRLETKNNTQRRRSMHPSQRRGKK